MTHIKPKDLITVEYLGENPTKVRPFLMGEKVDVKTGDKIEMDARQAATVLIDHLNWKKISEKKATDADKPSKDEEDEKPKKKAKK